MFNFCNRWLQAIIQFRAFKRSSRRNRMDELQNRPIYPCTILVIVANCGGFNAEEIWIDTSPRYIFQPETFSNGIGWRVKYEIVQEIVTVNSERLIVFEKSKWNNSEIFFLSKLGWKREQEYPFLSFNTRWFLVKEILESVRIFLLIWIFVWK